MTKRTRIYTRAGDDGSTGLVGGRRVVKSDLRIECFGDVDECSSAIGVARAALRGAGSAELVELLDRRLAWVQNKLFDVGAQLATAPDKRSPESPRVTERDVAALEQAIDEADDQLPPLDQFILPGGSQAGALLHVARAICRRAERHVVALVAAAPDDENLVRFLNRLSDAAFTWGRLVNAKLGVPEIPWQKSEN